MNPVWKGVFVMSFAAAAVAQGAVIAHPREKGRELYLMNIEAYAQKASLDGAIRLYDNGDGSLLFKWFNPDDDTLRASMRQDGYFEAADKVTFKFKVLKKKGNPRLFWRTFHLNNGSYSQEIPLPGENREATCILAAEADQLVDFGLDPSGPIGQGREVVCYGLDIVGAPGEELELLLQEAAVTERTGKTVGIFEPYEKREVYGPLEDLQAVPRTVKKAGPHIYVPGHISQLRQNSYREGIVKLNEMFGGVVGAHFSYPLPPAASRTMREYHELGIPVSMETHQSVGYFDYFTNRGLYLTDSTGFSPSDPATWESRAHRFPWPHHGLDYTRGDEVMVAMKDMIDRAAKLGITEILDIDLIWPWNGRWGYGPEQVEAYRRDLLGTDEGIVLEMVPGTYERLKFHDYLKLFTDVEFTPEMLGIEDFSDYSPVTEAQASNGDDKARTNLFLFVGLYHYELLKFVQRVALYAEKAGIDYIAGSNPEDIANGQDIYLISRLKGVAKYGYEFFGSPAGAQAWYHNLRFYSDNLKRRGKELYIIGEIAPGGHGASIFDHTAAYALYYDVTSAGKMMDYNMQYLEGHAWNGRNSPDPYHQERYQHWAGGARGFLQSHRESGRLPAPKPVAVIASRGILEHQSGLSNGLGQVNNLALLLDQLHYPFDLAGKEALSDGFADQAEILVYCPSQSSPMHFREIERWLLARPGRTLVTHSKVPFSLFRGGFDIKRDLENLNWRPDQSYESYSDIPVSKTGGTLFAFSGVRTAELRLPGIPAGNRTLYEAGNFTPLLKDENGNVLISERKWKNDSRVIYINSEIPSVPDALSRCLVDRAMRFAGASPEAQADPGLSIHRYGFPAGSSVVIWDMEILKAQDAAKSIRIGTKDWTVGENGELVELSPGESVRRLFRRVKLPAREVKLPVSPGEYRVYDFYNDEESLQTVPEGGMLELVFNGSVDIFYFGPAGDSKFRELLEQVRQTRTDVMSLAIRPPELKTLFQFDFETGENLPGEWRNVVPNGSYNRDNPELAHESSRSLLISAPQSGHDRWVLPGLRLDVSRRYRVTARGKMVRPGADDTMGLYVEYLGEDGQFIGAEYGEVLQGVADGEWHDLVLEFTPRVKNVNLLLNVGNGGDGTTNPDSVFCFDDVTISEISYDAPESGR